MPATTLYGLTYTVEVALSAATGSYGAWDAGLWNTATWGPDVVWTDVSQWVRSIGTQRQFDRTARTWDIGVASVELLNVDGRFSPVNLAGPYVTAGVTQVRPWRHIRIAFTWAGITYPVYRGYVVDWRETWVESSPGAGMAITTMQCVDEMGSLARFDGVPLPEIGGSETTGRRIHRILDNAGHAGMRDVDDGRMTCLPTTLDRNAAEELKLTADSEGGAVWVDRSGTLMFSNIYALIEDSRSNTIQATFGDAGAEQPYNDVGSEYNGDLLVNIAAFARAGGEDQIVADSTSRALYGDKRESRTDLVTEVDTQVATIAALWVQRFKDPEYRLTSVRVLPRTKPTQLFPAVLGREVRDLVRVKKRPPGGFTISQDVFISGISHTVTADDFVTVFDLSSGQPYTAYTTDRFGVAVWNTSTWFY